MVDDTLTRSITFEPAYDRRDPNPSKNYGIHGVVIRFVLKGDKGAVQFVLSTNWQLPHVTEERKGHAYDSIDGDPHWMERPMPADLGYHSPVPRYAGQTCLSETCPVLNGPCYYDGSTLNAEPVFARLLSEGDAGVWEALADYYHAVFDKEESGGFGELLHRLLGDLEDSNGD